MRLATLVPPLLVQGRSIEAVASSACLTLPHRLQCRAASLAVAAAAAFAAYVEAAATHESWRLAVQSWRLVSRRDSAGDS